LTNDQSREIVLKPCVGQHGAESVDHGVELAADRVGFGQWPRVGLVLAGTMAIEREFVEQMRGWRGCVRFILGIGVPRIKSGDRLEEVGAVV
jgi:hypothetical protein